MSKEEEKIEKDMENIVVLNDEEGNEVEFEFLDLIEHDNEEYVILLPVAEEDEGEVVILKIEDSESEEEEAYVSVDDEDILNIVFDLFKEKFKDEFNFVDEE